MSKFSLNTLGKLLADKSGLSQVEAELFIRKMFATRDSKPTSR